MVSAVRAAGRTRRPAEGIACQAAEAAVFPSDPARKLVSRARHATGGITLAVAGAPEPVLDRCRLDTAARENILGTVTRLTAAGMRVIAFARRRLDQVPAT